MRDTKLESSPRVNDKDKINIGTTITITPGYLFRISLLFGDEKMP